MLNPATPGRVLVRVSARLHGDAISADWPVEVIDDVRAEWLEMAREQGGSSMSPEEVSKTVVRGVLEGHQPKEIRRIIMMAALWLATEGDGGAVMLEKMRGGECVLAVTVSQKDIDARLIWPRERTPKTAH